MKKNHDNLRQRAMDVIKRQGDNLSKSGLKNIEDAFEEIHIYQIELELQNKELRNIQNKLELEKNKFADLYNNAPVGYMRLNAKGEIQEVNKRAAEIFNLRESILRNRPLVAFIVKEKMSLFHKYLRDLFVQIPTEEAGFRTTIINGRKEHRHIKISSNIMQDAETKEMYCRSIIEDITEQFDAELSIRKTNRILKNTEKIGNIGSWELDLNTGASHWSDEFFRICGFEPQAFKPNAEKGFELIHPEDRDKAQKTLSESIENGKSYVIEKRIVRPSGEIRWVLSRGDIIVDENGKPEVLSGTFQDITEQHETKLKIQQQNEEYVSVNEELRSTVEELNQANENLRKSEMKFKAIFNHVNDAIGIHEIKNNSIGPFIEVNRKASELFEYTKEEFLKMYPEKMLPKESGSDYNQILKVLLDKKRITVESRNRTKSGKYIPVEINASVYELDDKVFLATVVRDITERKEAQLKLEQNEEKLRSYIHNAPYGVFITNEKGRYVEINPAASKITGFSQKELLALSIPDLLPESERKMAKLVFQALVKKGRAQMESRYLTKKGQEKYWHVDAVKISKNLYLGFAFDITEQKRDRDALELSEEKYRLLSDLTFEGVLIHKGGVVIDFNKAFTRITGYDKKELVDVNIIKKLVHPRDIDLVKQKMIISQPGPYEITAVHKNGENIPIELESKNFKYQDEDLRVVSVRDLRERKKAEMQIKELADERQRILESISDGFFVLDRNMIFEYFNEAAEKLQGKKKEEVIGKHLIEAFPETKGSIIEKKYYQAQKNQERVSFEVFFEPHNNWYQINAYPYNEKISVFYQVINEQKEAQKRLKTSEEKYKRLADATFESIFFSKKGICIDQNSTAEKMFGYTLKEAKGRNAMEWIHPDHHEELTKKLKENIAKPYDSVALRKDGSSFPCEIQAKTIQFGNEQIRITALRDISDRKAAEIALQESEKKYRQLFNLIPVGIVVSNKSGQILETNVAAQKLLRLSKEEVEKRSINSEKWKIIDPQGRKMNAEDFASVRAIKENRLVENIQMGLYHDDNDITWINVSATPLVSNPDYIVIAYADITEKVIQEQKIHAYTEKLKELNATKDKFFSIIAHDLKSPFNTMMVSSNLLKSEYNDYNDHERIEFISIINESIKKTYKLLENLLSWSKTQREKVEMKMQEISAEELILENIQFHASFANSKNIQIQKNIPQDITIKVDVEMINTVIRNLISNAIKFTNEGGTVEIGFHMDDMHQFKCYVKDNGIGISEKNQKKLFRIDQNFTQRGTQQEKGTGLGLILCKEFIEKHFGKIWVKSKEQKGATFFFTLPLK